MSDPTRPWSLIVDSGASPPDGVPGVEVVPMHLEIGGISLRDGVDITPEEVYARLEAGGLVHTSTPSPGEFLEAMRRSEGEVIVCLTLPASLSGVHQSATVAAGLLAEAGDRRRVIIVDSGTAAAGLALVARIAMEKLSAGVPLEELESRVGRARDDVVLIGCLGTLAYLGRSGRVPAVAAGVGDLLKVRPLLELRHGGVRRIGLVRGEERVIAALRRAAVHTRRDDPRRPLWLLTVHAAAPERAARMRRELHAALPIARSETLPMSPVMGAYTGPGMVAYGLLPLADDEVGEVD